jgi:hypothetical protein
MSFFWLIVAALVAFVPSLVVLNSWLRLRRAEFIRTYKWPKGSRAVCASSSLRIS